MMHIFLGEEPDPEALAKLTKRLLRTKLVYWSYTPAVTVCNACGRSSTGLHTACPPLRERGRRGLEQNHRLLPPAQELEPLQEEGVLEQEALLLLIFGGGSVLTSGWKSVSMVDVHGKVTFTLWLCGCNLKCPFCHNWLIAEGKECFPLDRGALLGDLSSSSFLVDYFHITGGEPLMQWAELSSLLAEAKELLPISLNTNLTLLKPLERLLKAELVDHIATDLKAPLLLSSTASQGKHQSASGSFSLWALS